MEKKLWLNSILLVIIIILLSFGVYLLLQGQMEEVVSQNLIINKNDKDLIVPLSIDLSDEIAAAHKDILFEAINKPANFAGHYVVASWGCGSGCQNFSIIDKLTGKVYIGPSDDYGNKEGYFGDSNFEETRFSLGSNTIKTIGYDSINVFTFENEIFVKTQSLTFPKKIEFSTALPTPYIRAQSLWPPKIEELPITYTCDIGMRGMGVQTVTEERFIGGNRYCLSLIREGAVGTIYKTYKYSTESNLGIKTTTFTLAYPNSDGCNGRGTVEENKCETAQLSFDVDMVINDMFNTK